MDKYNIAVAYDHTEVERTPDALFIHRLRIESAMAELRRIKDELDQELILVMKEKGIASFEFGMEERRQIVKYGKQKKDTINANALRKWLSGTDEERLMALDCLSGGQSVWKAAQVRMIQDSIGRDDLIKTDWFDKIEVKAVPVDKLK
jgi:hypothetical protein